MVSKIEITNTAKNNLSQIFLFYRKIAGNDIAQKVLNEIKNTILTIPIAPFKGVIDDSPAALREHEICRIIIKHFKIYYLVTESRIFIMAIFDTRQNPNKLKL